MLLKIIKLAAILYIISGPFHYGQQADKSRLDSLYNRFLFEKGYDTGIKSTFPESEISIPINKCGVPLIMEIRNNMQYFSPEQQSVLKVLLEPFPTEASIVSESGIFRIHYDRSGSKMPAYNSELSADENAALAAEAFDSSYNYLVNYLGYPPPPPDDTAGGDSKYDVYIDNLARDYGYTNSTTLVEPGGYKLHSYIVIDNNYTTHNTKGVAALNVTAAHELHHAIQFGCYRYLSDEGYYFEMVSTTMEEFVYDSVNDYYYYLDHYFDETSRAFNRSEGGDGYDLIVWNLFLADTLGRDIIRDQLELISDNNIATLDAISRSLQQKGTTFADMMHEFGVWCFYTDYRAIDSMYFEEGAYYPLAAPLENLIGTPVVSGSLPPASNSFIGIVNYVNGFPDSLMILISNSDYPAATANPYTLLPYKFTLYHNSSGNSAFNEDYSYKFEADKPFSWTISAFLDNILLTGNAAPAYARNYAFPSPFYYGRHSKVQIGIEGADVFAVTHFSVYTSAMKLVYSSIVTPYKDNGELFIDWQVMDNDQSKLSSGVYIYAIQSGEYTSVGKLVIFSE